MHFPTNEHLRQSWYSVQVADGALKKLGPGETVQLSGEMLADLIDAPSFEELRRQTANSIKKGVVAGDILASIYLMDRFEMPEPSMRKAVHIAQRFAANTEYGDSTPMLRSRRKARDAFREFKTVAHLWAAFRLNRVYRFAEDRALFSEQLPLFLEVSAGLLEFGKCFIPYRARPAEPILPPDAMWELPAGTVIRNLKSESFPTRLRSLLEDYDPSEYQY